MYKGGSCNNDIIPCSTRHAHLVRTAITLLLRLHVL
jgi:hypothetical protein